MSGYVKISEGLLTSSAWALPDSTRMVWITLLLCADRRGEVFASLPWLARRAGVTEEQCEAAISSLAGPDPTSRTPTYEGRRIEPIEKGWRVLNFEKYQSMGELHRQRNRARQAKYRQRQKAALAAKGTG